MVAMMVNVTQMQIVSEIALFNTMEHSVKIGSRLLKLIKVLIANFNSLLSKSGRTSMSVPNE